MNTIRFLLSLPLIPLFYFASLILSSREEAECEESLPLDLLGTQTATTLQQSVELVPQRS